jgi:hypothetical protein
MHYWYFNIVTPKTRENYTYILANVSTPTRLNDVDIPREKDRYISILSDFLCEHSLVEEKQVEIEDNTLKTDNFQFTIKDGKAIVHLQDQEIIFDRVLTDSYVDKIGGLYDWSSINFGNGHQYMNAESVMKRGPLPPWNWLHFFLEDGTYIKTFNLPFHHLTPLRVNDTELYIQNIIYGDSTVKYLAKKDDKYFTITLGLDKFKAHNEYSPLFSPCWKYDQYSPSLIEIDTNLDGINPKQAGGGIMEIARGWSF